MLPLESLRENLFLDFLVSWLPAFLGLWSYYVSPWVCGHHVFSFPPLCHISLDLFLIRTLGVAFRAHLDNLPISRYLT